MADGVPRYSIKTDTQTTPLCDPKLRGEPAERAPTMEEMSRAIEQRDMQYDTISADHCSYLLDDRTKIKINVTLVDVSRTTLYDPLGDRIYLLGQAPLIHITLAPEYGAHLDRTRHHTDFSLIAFGSRVIRALGSLGHPGLDAELQGGVALDAPPPGTRTCPFSIHDDPAHVDRITAQGTRGCPVNHPDRARTCLSTGTVAGWTPCSTRPFHDRFSPEHRAKLTGAIRRSNRRLYAAVAVGSLAGGNP